MLRQTRTKVVGPVGEAAEEIAEEAGRRGSIEALMPRVQSYNKFSNRHHKCRVLLSRFVRYLL
jgi:hypothetical protein